MKSKEAFKEYKEIYVDKTFKGECCPTQDWYLEIIEKDLEVLEIIRKKEVFIGELKYAFKTRKNDKEFLHFYNWGKDAKLMLTMEELLKLKQWLGVNDNE